MASFMTGATGFIGRHLLETLLQRGETVHCLVRGQSQDRLREIALRAGRGQGKGRVVPVQGDLSLPQLGVGPELLEELRGSVQHFFHLAARVDLSSDSESLADANVEGTRRALELARELDAGCFHHMSCVAVAGHYRGTFTESMLAEVEPVDGLYASSKHDAEALVRTAYPGAYRIYRPSIVVGNSETGEIDKVEGVTFLFRMIQRLRESVPEWLPRLGIEGAALNVVPVDYVARAVDHIAHSKDLDGQTFHLVAPESRPAGEIIDEICRAARAPTFSKFIPLPPVPRPIARLLAASERLPAVRRVSDAVLSEAGIPRPLLGYLTHSTEYDCEEARRALAGSGIEVPAFESYVDRLWDFWELNYSKVPARNPRLARAVEGKCILLCRCSGPVESVLAMHLAASGAELILIDADASGLDRTRQQVVRAGGLASAYAVDLAAPQKRAALVARMLDQHPRIDIAICGSGEVPPCSGGPGNVDLAAFEAPMRQYAFGALGMVLPLLPGMRERGAGQVLLLSSLALDGSSDPGYVAATLALESFSQSLAPDLAAAGVRLTSVHLPGLRGPADAEAGDRPSLGAITPERAAGLVCDALIRHPRRASTWLGATAERTRAAAPEAFEAASSVLARWPVRSRVSAEAPE